MISFSGRRVFGYHVELPETLSDEENLPHVAIACILTMPRTHWHGILLSSLRRGDLYLIEGGP